MKGYSELVSKKLLMQTLTHVQLCVLQLLSMNNECAKHVAKPQISLCTLHFWKVFCILHICIQPQ